MPFSIRNTLVIGTTITTLRSVSNLRRNGTNSFTMVKKNITRSVFHEKCRKITSTALSSNMTCDFYFIYTGNIMLVSFGDSSTETPQCFARRGAQVSNMCELLTFVFWFKTESSKLGNLMENFFGMVSLDCSVVVKLVNFMN